MGARDREGTDHGKTRRNPARRRDAIGAAVNAAIGRGFVIGREVMVGSIPGIVVGYNIANFGRFAGNPLSAGGTHRTGRDPMRNE